MQYSELSFRAHDGIRLHARHYQPAPSARRGRSMVIVHGTSEHSGRYQHVAHAATAAGWEVVCLDMRGHGRSEGIPVHVERFDRYLHDLDSLWQFFELNPARTAVLAHSFGGLVAIRYAQTRAQRMSALVLSSPLLGLTVKIDRLTLALGRLMSFVAPCTRFQSKVPVEHTTRNPIVLKQRLLDPLLHRSVTASWFFQMKAALKHAWNDVSLVTSPILAVQAGDDRIVDPHAPRGWLDLVTHSDTHLEILPDHFHEVLNETDWESTLGTMLTWLDKRLPGPEPNALDKGQELRAPGTES